jgi:hypothetical protein
MEYENLTQNVLFGNAILPTLVCDWFIYTFIFHKQFYFIISGVKNIGHGNPDNNLESSRITAYDKRTIYRTL